MRLLTVAPLLALLAVVPQTAHAAPPPAWTCSAVVTGIRVPHRVTDLVITAEVDTVQAVITCNLTGLLTTPPIDDAALYSGDATIGVLIDGYVHSCGSTYVAGEPTFVPSAGPTLVMAVRGECVFPATEPASTEHTPYVLWATHDLSSQSDNYTLGGQGGTWLAL
jgi:hypothetical protein